MESASRPDRPILHVHAWLPAGALLALAIVACGASGQTPPPATGDWVIADATTLSDTSVALEGNLRVVAGGSLALDEVAVTMGGTMRGELAVRVEAGGSLRATRSSFTASDVNITYRFEVRGDLALEDALVEHTWGDALAGLWGVQLHGVNASILNTTVRYGEAGNLLVRGGSPSIRGSTFSHARFSLSHLEVSTCGGVISLSARGAQFEAGATPTLEASRFEFNGDGGNFSDPWRDYYLAYGNASACGGFFFLDERFLGTGLAVERSSPQAFGNTYAWNGQVPGNASDFFLDNSTFVVVNRYGFHRGDWTGSEFEAIGSGLFLNASTGNFTSETVHNNTGYGVRANAPNAELSWFQIMDTQSATASGGAAVGVGTGVRISNSSLARNGAAFRFYGDLVAYVADVSVGSFGSSPAVIKENEFGFIRFVRTPLASAVPLEMRGFGRTTIDFYDSPVNLSTVRNIGSSVTLRIFWKLDVSARWTTGVPISSAPLTVANQSGGVEASATLDLRGEARAMWAMQRMQSTDRGSPNGTIDNSRLFASIEVGGVVLGPVEFGFATNTFVPLVFQDPFPPSLAVLTPHTGAVIPVSNLTVTGYAYDVGSGLAGLRYTLDRGVTWVAYNGTLPLWSVDLSLADGIYDIWVEAADADNHTARVVIGLVTVDTQPPEIRVVDPPLAGPPPYQVAINTSAYQVRGTVSELSNLTLNDDPVVMQGTSFAVLLSFEDGRSTVELRAVDRAGHASALRFAVLVDVSPPLLLLDPAGPTLLTNRSLLNLRVEVDPQATLRVNGAPVEHAGSTALVPVLLSEGHNTIEVEAVDPAGNRALRTLEVTLDSAAPLLSISAPAPGAVLRLPDVQVTGSVSEPGCIVWVAGVLATVEGLEFAAVVNLAQGSHLLRVEAKDAAGNAARGDVSVEIDWTSPTLSVEPPGAAVTNATSFLVQGVAVGAARVTVDGVEAPMDGAAFALHVPLGEGENTFAVRAFDAAGNEANATLRLTADRTAPAVSILGSANRTTTQATVLIEGAAPGAAIVRVNGVAFVPSGDGSFQAVVPVDLGSTTIVVEAQDAAGNLAVGQVGVRRVDPEGAQGSSLDLATAALAVALVAGGAFAGGWFASRRVRGPGP